MFEIGSLLCGLAPNMVRYYIFSLTLVVSFSQKNNNPSFYSKFIDFLGQSLIFIAIFGKSKDFPAQFLSHCLFYYISNNHFQNS